MRREEVGEDGRATSINEFLPTRWNLGDVSRLLETAQRLGTAAVGEETEGARPGDIGVSADDLAAAARAVAEWEAATYELGGTSAALSSPSQDKPPVSEIPKSVH